MKPIALLALLAVGCATPSQKVPEHEHPPWPHQHRITADLAPGNWRCEDPSGGGPPREFSTEHFETQILVGLASVGIRYRDRLSNEIAVIRQSKENGYRCAQVVTTE